MKEYIPLIIAAFNGLLIPFCVWLVSENTKRKEEVVKIKEELLKHITDMKTEMAVAETRVKSELEIVKEKNREMKTEHSYVSEKLQEVYLALEKAKSSMEILMLKLLKTKTA